MEHAWGGPASNEKVRVMINEVISFFGHSVQNGGKVRRPIPSLRLEARELSQATASESESAPRVR